MMKMLDIDFERVLKLPALSLENRDLLPQSPGIYFCLGENSVNTKKIIYIGQTINLRDRWYGHHRLRDLFVILAIGIPVTIAWLEFYAPVGILLEQEQHLIREFHPPLNFLRLVEPGTDKLTEKLTKVQLDNDELRNRLAQNTQAFDDKPCQGFTPFNLTRFQAVGLINRLRQSGLNQTQIIYTLWDAKPGANEAYQNALTDYKELDQ